MEHNEIGDSSEFKIENKWYFSLFDKSVSGKKKREARNLRENLCGVSLTLSSHVWWT